MVGWLVGWLVVNFDGFHHIGLYSADAEKSLRFYTEGLGGKETSRFGAADTGKTIYLVDLGNNAVVEIVPKGSEEPESNARWAHIAVRTNDARAAYEGALRAGATSRSAPKDGNLGDLPVCNAFVYGPDGEVIEFFQVG